MFFWRTMTARPARSLRHKIPKRRSRIVSNKIRQALMLACVAICVINCGPTKAADPKSLNPEILDIAKSWGHTKFEDEHPARQQKDIPALPERAPALMKKYPGRPEPVIWKGVLLSEGASMANEDNSMFAARSLAYEARDTLLEAEKMDPGALEAGAPTSLGVLYYRVPSFPIAF